MYKYKDKKGMSKFEFILKIKGNIPKDFSCKYFI